MEASKFTEKVDGRNFAEEGREAVNNSNENNDVKDKHVENFLEMEATLNDLFTGILANKTQLHTVVQKLAESINELQIKGDEVASNRIKIEEQNSVISEMKKVVNNSKEQEEELKKSVFKNFKLEKEVKKLKEECGYLDSRERDLSENLEKCQEEKDELEFENSKLRKEGKLEDQIGSTVRSESQNTIKRSNSFDSSSFVDLSHDSDYDDEANLERKSDDESVKAKQENKAKQEHLMEIELMDSLFGVSWRHLNTFLMDQKIVSNILFDTLWESNKFMMDMKSMQLKKSKINLHFPFSSESENYDDADLETPESIVHSLEECMSKVEPKDVKRVFKDKLMKKLDPKTLEYLKDKPEFISYIHECLHLSRQLIFKSKYLHLQSHPIGKLLDEESFAIYSGSEQGEVVSVIFPALIHSKDGKKIILKKGFVLTDA